MKNFLITVRMIHFLITVRMKMVVARGGGVINLKTNILLSKNSNYKFDCCHSNHWKRVFKQPDCFIHIWDVNVQEHCPVSNKFTYSPIISAKAVKITVI